MQNNTTQQKLMVTRYIPVSRFKEFHPWPTPQGLRNRIAAAKKVLQQNEQGDKADSTEVDDAKQFLKCVKWVGGRVLVDEQEFFAWLERQSVAERERAGWLSGW
jgi:hypothetical protein